MRTGSSARHVARTERATVSLDLFVANVHSATGGKPRIAFRGRRLLPIVHKDRDFRALPPGDADGIHASGHQNGFHAFGSLQIVRYSAETKSSTTSQPVPSTIL